MSVRFYRDSEFWLQAVALVAVALVVTFGAMTLLLWLVSHINWECVFK